MRRDRFSLRALGSIRPNVVIVVALFALHAPFVLAEPARTTVTFPLKGLEDDVDVVVSPSRGFLVVCEEDNDELEPAQVQIIGLDPASGAPLGPLLLRPALGFENAVDPMIIRLRGEGAGWAVLVPQESEDGSQAGILVLRLNDDGTFIEEVLIELGELGFHPDVDGVWAQYNGPLVAYYALESEDGAYHGAIAIDVDIEDSDADGDPEFGSCSVVSNSAAGVCDVSVFADWIPGFPDAVDPVAYEVLDCCSRLALPVAGAGGNDLLMIDWDPNFEPPLYIGHNSVKALNAGTARPLAFPGWERDVDISDFPGGECGAFAPQPWILIPVEGDADDGDLYLVDRDGTARWVYSIDGGTAGPPIPGYEQGVDLVRVCGLAGPHPSRIVVPVEDALGTDADILVVDFLTGEFLGHVEDPTINPGVTVLGFEVGVEPLPWTPADILVPMEGLGGAGLLVIDPDARVISSLIGPPILGFARSVDPIVAAWPDPDRTLFVPVSSADGDDSNVLRFPLAPDVGAFGNLETLNPPIAFAGFEWDVDLGLVKKSDPGSAFLIVPEEDQETGEAQLRFEPVPAVPVGRVLVVPTPQLGLTSAKIYGFKTSDGLSLGSFDVLGYQTGVDIASGRGPLIAANPPAFGVPAGFDADTDPTLRWDILGSGVGDVPKIGNVKLAFANPFRAPGRIAWRQESAGSVRLDLIDLAGRRLVSLHDGWLEAGEHAVEWDGRDASGRVVPSGVFFIRLGDDRGSRAQALVILR